MPTKTKLKQTRVTRQFMLDLAESIYSSRNRTFLRLCNGTLQNGPDPTNPKRPMHCGLGELYYAITGVQPEETGVGERDVIELAVERSHLAGGTEKAVKAFKNKHQNLIKVLKKSGGDANLVEELVDTVRDRLDDGLSDIDDEDENSGVIRGLTPPAEAAFREALSDIPSRNDDNVDDEVCSLDNWKDRSKRVAAQLKLAANALKR